MKMNFIKAMKFKNRWCEDENELHSSYEEENEIKERPKSSSWK